jgi:hypothetical protein
MAARVRCIGHLRVGDVALLRTSYRAIPDESAAAFNANTVVPTSPNTNVRDVRVLMLLLMRVCVLLPHSHAHTRPTVTRCRSRPRAPRCTTCGWLRGSPTARSCDALWGRLCVSIVSDRPARHRRSRVILVDPATLFGVPFDINAALRQGKAIEAYLDQVRA